MNMTRTQYGQAIEKLKEITSISEDDLLEYEDYELGQFLYEQGYTWDEWDKEWVPEGAEVEA